MESFDSVSLLDLEIACLHIRQHPTLRRNIEVMLNITSYHPKLVRIFDLTDLLLVKEAVKQFRLAPYIVGYLSYPITKNPEFIEFVFREAPHYAKYIDPSQELMKTFTPKLMEHVMNKIHTMAYSQQMMMYLPLVQRRMYAHHKVREREGFHMLLFKGKNVVSRLPSELKQEVANYLGLVKSRRWLQILELVNRQVY